MAATATEPTHPDALVRAIRVLRTRFDALMDDCVRACADGVPALADPDLRTTLRRSCEASVTSMLRLLEAGQQMDRDRVPDAALTLARDLVHLGADPEAIQHGYRVGHNWFQKCVLAAAAEEVSSASELHAVTVRVNDWCFSWFNTMHVAMAAEFVAESARWQPSGAAVRAAAIGSLLDGACDDVDAANTTLGYDLRGRHVAAILWHDAESGSVDLRAALTRARGSARGGRALIHEVSSSAIWTWWPEQSGMPREAFDPGVHLAIGEVRDGVEGFRRTHEDAQSARRVVLRGAAPAPTVTRFRDIELISLLTADGARCDDFVREALGALAECSRPMAGLRATLLAVFEESSIQAAAARLGVHPNTVVYRMHKAEDLLGHGIHEHRLRLQTALHVADGLAMFSDDGERDGVRGPPVFRAAMRSDTQPIRPR